jgi:type III pantothenate kinase
MTIVIDIGNTRIKWARVAGGQMLAQGHAVHSGSPERALEAMAAAAVDPAQRIVAASVAGGSFAQRLDQLALQRWGVAIEWVEPAAEQFGLRCGYADCRRLGVDRWVAMVGARQSLAGAFSVVDAGTTVTFDAVDADGQHLGGLIMPGPHMIAHALNIGTRGIGAVDIEIAPPPTGLDLLGHSTAEAVSHAAMLQVAAAIDRAVAIVATALSEPPVVVLTGGDGPALARWLETETQYRADLVLEGLAFMVSQR